MGKVEAVLLEEAPVDSVVDLLADEFVLLVASDAASLGDILWGFGGNAGRSVVAEEVVDVAVERWDDDADETVVAKDELTTLGATRLTFGL